ncbi:YkyA family protein [Psychrobacillus sp.]|uniref:YkyA family protein n=1 Tax=Psychrobacillus sp. TaxID=1871623 RepID=UPI0028BE49D5|nr:YkyA family protein [Psychrobacillus sp.]
MKKIVVMLSLCFLTLLSACSFGESTNQKLSNILTTIYESEADYRGVQSELVGFEKKEQTNFQRMMELTQEQKEELTKLVDETEKLLGERLTLVEKEAASIKLASDKMVDLEKLISEVKEEKEKTALKQIEEVLKNRYASYEELTAQYNSLASLQEDLYSLLIEEGSEMTSIQEKVQEVNAQNEVVQKHVEQFNELTVRLNEVKEEVFTALQDEK